MSSRGYCPLVFHPALHRHRSSVVVYGPSVIYMVSELIRQWSEQVKAW